MKRLLAAISAAALGSLWTCRASGTADQVVVVYNSRLPESKEVAEHYSQKRQVPESQVFSFPLPLGDDITRREFQEGLQKPLAKTFSEKGLWRIASVKVPATTNQPAHTEMRVVESRIRYLVLCFGVPLRIPHEPELKEEGLEKIRPEMRRNGAAVDSELALLPAIEQKYPLHGPLGNWTYGVTNADLLHPTNGVLLVTRLDGPTAVIARELVDKALEAERDGLWGRAYFDVRNISEPGMKLGDDWIRAASEICRRLGFETVVDEHPGTFPASFPLSHIAFYAGWYSQDVNGPFALPTVEFMPGAFAYHLHSYSACSLRNTNRSWAGPLLAKGATATMGCVDEPYLAGTPDIAIFAARFLYHRFTFGEAAYACQQVLSWQTTVVGDPLYHPVSRKPEELEKELAQRHSKLEEWYVMRLVNVNLAAGKTAGDAVTLIEGLPLTRQSAVLMEKLGDLFTTQGKPSSAAHAYQEALKLDPSPEQRIRLLLTLGDKLPALDRHAEAYEAYQTLLRDCPQYPDTAAVLKKLLPLARRLDRKSDADSYEARLKNFSGVTSQ